MPAHVVDPTIVGPDTPGDCPIPSSSNADSTHLRTLLALYILPSLYGFATRVTFVFFPIYLRFTLGFSVLDTGLLIGFYQLQRAFANGIVGKFGSASLFPLVAISFTGFLVNALWPELRASPWCVFSL
jgi:hypothetical protein